MRIRHIGIVLTVALFALGYLGAGLFYGYLLGFDTQTPWTCPVCPNIASLGNPLHTFLARTVVLGTLNALFLLGIAWILRGLVAVMGKLRKAKRIERQNIYGKPGEFNGSTQH
jgi:hypothetical protein